MHLFIMPAKHRLAGRDYIEGKDVEGEPFITCTKVPEPNREFARLFRPADSQLQWTATVELPEAIVELVVSDIGSNALSNWARQSAFDEGRIIGARVTENGVRVA